MGTLWPSTMPARARKKNSASEPIVVVDTREWLPYQFAGSIRRKLAAGDYSLDGFTTEVAVERKTLEDLFGTVGRGRRRFLAELERLRTYRHAAIVIEATLAEVLIGPAEMPRTGRRCSPKAVIGSLVRWGLRYGVQVCYAGTRTLAAAWTRKFLEMAVDEMTIPHS